MINNQIYFLSAKSLDMRLASVDCVFIARTEKDRDDIVYALKLHGNSGAKAISRDEAFATVEPSAGDLRRFNFYGSGDYLLLGPDWSPEQTAERLAAGELARDERHARNDAAWKARFKGAT